MTSKPIVADDLVQAVHVLFTEPGYEPPMIPAVALQLQALTRREDVEFDEVQHLLESDPLLAARVLKLTQSPAYAARACVATLHDALVRLGVNTLTQIFLEVAVTSRVFRAAAYQKPMDDLRAHSSLTAHACRAICTELGLPNDGAFLCGLLHDVGMAVGMVALSNRRIFPETPDYVDIEPVLLEAHERIGAYVADVWCLSPDVRAVLASHHQETTSLLDMLVRAGDGFASACAHQEERPAPCSASVKLELEPEQLDNVWTELQRIRAA